MFNQRQVTRFERHGKEKLHQHCVLFIRNVSITHVSEIAWQLLYLSCYHWTAGNFLEVKQQSQVTWSIDAVGSCQGAIYKATPPGC